MEDTQKCNRCHVDRDTSFFTEGSSTGKNGAFKIQTYVTCSKCRKQRRGYWHGERTGQTTKIKHLDLNGKPAKACTQCKIIKTIDNFSKAIGKSTDDLKATCKACIKLEAQTEEGKKQQAIRSKRYYMKNAKIINQKGKEWNQRNKEHVKRRNRAYMKKRYIENPQYRVACCLRTRLHRTLADQEAIKSGKTIDLLGCPVGDLMKHLESLFEEGMSWENYGEWHIDHIKPCAKFNLTLAEEQSKCFHYSNLQPLWASDNMSKGAKWTEEDEIQWVMFREDKPTIKIIFLDETLH